jgi:hypothetical protein
MIHSTNRILTTHTGSLPRPAKVVELLLAEEKNPAHAKPNCRPPCAAQSPMS